MNWPVVNLRRVARLGTGHTPSRQHPEYWENCTVPWLTLADVWQLRDESVTTVAETAERISELGVSNSSAVVHPAGTVAMSRTASVGYSCILGADMATSQDFVTWTCSPLIEPRFLLHALRGAREQILGMRMGSTHQTIYMPDVERIALPLPGINEQRSIADFLDAETARIDALIAKKRRLIELLDERLRSIVLGMTTDEGEWVPLRRLIVSIKTGTTPPADALQGLTGDEVAWYSPGDVGPRTELGSAARHLSEDAIAGGWLPRFSAGSTVVVGIGATAGRVAHLLHEATGNQQMSCISPNRGLDGRFLSWQLWAREAEFREQAPYTTLPILNNDYLRSFLVCTPLPNAQRAISTLLTAESDRTNEITNYLEQQISLLIEHRQAIITAAVTGELEVPGAAP